MLIRVGEHLKNSLTQLMNYKGLPFRRYNITKTDSKIPSTQIKGKMHWELVFVVIGYELIQDGFIGLKRSFRGALCTSTLKNTAIAVL